MKNIIFEANLKHLTNNELLDINGGLAELTRRIVYGISFAAGAIAKGILYVGEAYGEAPRPHAGKI